MTIGEREIALARKAARDLGGTGNPLIDEELELAAIAALVQADATYDPARCATRAHWLWWKAQHAAMDERRRWTGRAGGHRNRGYTNTVSLDQALADDGEDDDEHVLADIVLGADEPGYDIVDLDDQIARTRLTRREALVTEALAHGTTRGELAAQLGVTPSRISQLSTRAAARIRGDRPPAPPGWARPAA